MCDTSATQQRGAGNLKPASGAMPTALRGHGDESRLLDKVTPLLGAMGAMPTALRGHAGHETAYRERVSAVVLSRRCCIVAPTPSPPHCTALHALHCNDATTQRSNDESGGPRTPVAARFSGQLRLSQRSTDETAQSKSSSLSYSRSPFPSIRAGESPVIRPAPRFLA
jgi:hypothetical protein